MRPYPEWLHVLSWIALGVAFLSAMIILVDVIWRPQKMGIMNLVWPITGLYWGPVALWGYLRVGRKTTKEHHAEMMDESSRQMKRKREQMKSAPPTRTQVMVGVSHCGAGCTLGDIGGEWWVAAMGLVFAGGAFQTRLLLDFVLAWIFGIGFQYFTIVPMRGLSVAQGIAAAIKADTISIVAFQVGMSIWMALTYFVLFPGPHLQPNEAVFWFMMQIAMIIGYFTAYPANAWLLKKGLKEKMPESPDAARQLEQPKAA